MFTFGGRYIPISANSNQVPRMDQSPEVQLENLPLVTLSILEPSSTLENFPTPLFTTMPKNSFTFRRDMTRYQESFDAMAADASNYHKRGYNKRSYTHTCLSLFSILGYRSYEQGLGQSEHRLTLPEPHLPSFRSRHIRKGIHHSEKATWTLYLHIQCRQHMPATLIAHSAAISRSIALAAFL